MIKHLLNCFCIFGQSAFAGLNLEKDHCYKGKIVSFDYSSITLENKTKRYLVKLKNPSSSNTSIVPELGKTISMCGKVISSKKLN